MFSYNDEAVPMRSAILNRGDLVYIKTVLDLDGIKPKLGIIIQCLYGFGYDSEEWLVLIEGKLERISGSVIWPVE